MKKKIVIVGGGASGLMCAVAIKARLPEAQVTILEQLDRPGKKILASGNGRCNFSNLSINEENYFGDKKFIKAALDETTLPNVLNEFARLGLSYSSDEAGRLYPASFQAQTILRLLQRKCTASGVEILTSTEVTRISEINGAYNISSNNGNFKCDVLVLANGGRSGQALGSNGSGYAIAKNMGHQITPTFPAIVQLKSSSRYVKALKGTRVKANISLEIDQNLICENSGEILFTDYGLSGICTMEISRFVSSTFQKKPHSKIFVSIDLLPNMSQKQLSEALNELIENGFEPKDLLIGLLPVKLAEMIAKQANFDTDLMCKIAKSWKLEITGTLGFDHSQVTCGGVDTAQIYPNTMMSKIHNNLYIIGELLNIDGKCGGFNLHWAWVSGIASGKSIATTLNGEVLHD